MSARQQLGPSAIAGDPHRFLVLTRTLAVTDFKLRFFGSVLGYLWQLMRPLMLFGVIYVVFTQFVEVSDQDHFPASLLLGIVLYTFFAEATGAAVTSVVDRENLVRKIHFPRLAIPMAVVVTASFNLALNMLVVIVFALSIGVDVRWTWLELPVLLVLLGMFATGLSALLSALYVRFRDMKPIWEVMLQVLFYGSMIIVPFETVHAKFPTAAQWLLVNPLAAMVQQARHAVVSHDIPGAAAAIGGWGRMMLPIAIAVGTMVLGLWYFRRQAPLVAEDL